LKNIKFMPLSNDVKLAVDMPYPARKILPDWYKSAGAFHTKTPEINSHGKVNSTFKLCMPFYDAISGGYIQVTWSDIKIDFNEDTKVVTYYYHSPLEQISHRDRDPDKTFIKTSGFYNSEFTWPQPWIPKLPKGYSVLYTHPLNRLDLPFMSTSGIVEADNDFVGSFPNNLPFYIKYGFTGIIPAGTPMYQIIPFKRENWKSQKIGLDEESQKRSMLILSKHFWGSYKKYWWVKKKWD
jgi:hypothetical protein